MRKRKIREIRDKSGLVMIVFKTRKEKKYIQCFEKCKERGGMGGKKGQVICEMTGILMKFGGAESQIFRL